MFLQNFYLSNVLCVGNPPIPQYYILFIRPLQNGKYYVIVLYGRVGRLAYARWFPLNISRIIWCILIKFGTQKHQDKTKTKFELGDLDLIFKVTEVIEGDDIWKMVCKMILLNLIFEITEVIRDDDMKDGLRSVSEEIFDVSLRNMVHRSTNAKQRPSLNWVTVTSFSRSQRSFKSTTYKRWFALNIWKKRILTKFGTQKYQCKTKTNFEPGDLDLIFKVTDVI